MKRTIELVMVLVASGLIGNAAEADFIVGTPTNLGSKVNSSSLDAHPSISADGLSIYFYSTRPSGRGGRDIWMATRETTDSEWNAAVNLGPPVNSPYRDSGPSISDDGLTLFFDSDRPGGSGGPDAWMTTRTNLFAPWSEPVNLGPTVNSSSDEAYMNISANGLELYFQSDRPGGVGGQDLWVTTRETKDDPWGIPVNLGPTINSPFGEGILTISPDSRTLFFASDRPGGYITWDLYIAPRNTVSGQWGEPLNLGPTVNSADMPTAAALPARGYSLYFPSWPVYGIVDLWQVSIEPVLDLNGDEVVDAADMSIMVDNWGTDNSLCDIGPMPWGDGIVDVEDLKVLAEHLFEEILPPDLMAYWKLDEAEFDVAHESIGGNDDEVIGNPLWQPTGGQVDGALELDGVDDYVICSFKLDPADGPFSVFACVKGGAAGQAVISQWDGANWLMADADGRLMTELASSGRDGIPLRSEVVIADGQWHRIGLVWDGSNRTLCVDGVVVAEDTQSGLAASGGGLHIGVGKDFAPGSFFSGLIDDVRIYNRAVSL